MTKPKNKAHFSFWLLTVIVLFAVESIVLGYPYADDFPYHLHPAHTSQMKSGKQVLLSATSSKGAREVSERLNDARDHIKDDVFEEANGINSASDAVRYHLFDNERNGHKVVDANKGSTVDKVKHLAGENFEADKSHNRKHVKSGFTNSYHKDESGSKSSYYENSDDRGGKQVYDNRHNLRNDYVDKLFSQDRRSDYLHDHQNDRAGSTELLGAHNYMTASSLDRGNVHDHRDGSVHNDHLDRHYGATAYGGYDYYQPKLPTSNFYDVGPYRRRLTFYVPRPTFASAPITIYEDPQENASFAKYTPQTQSHPSLRDERDGMLVFSRDNDYHQFDEFGQRRRLIYKPNSALPYDGFRRY